MTRQDRYKDRVAETLADLAWVTSGAVLGCRGCLSRVPMVAERTVEDWIERVETPHFSWHPCGLCRSPLSGHRSPAHGIDPSQEIVHLEICDDCVRYLADGTIPEVVLKPDGIFV